MSIPGHAGTSLELTTAYDAFCAADDAWNDERERVFGRVDARMTRYLPEGQGKPGSELERRWLARETARIAFEDIYPSSERYHAARAADMPED